MFPDNLAVTDHPSSWGQLLMVGIPGPRVDAVARELVRDLKFYHLAEIMTMTGNPPTQV